MLSLLISCLSGGALSTTDAPEDLATPWTLLGRLNIDPTLYESTAARGLFGSDTVVATNEDGSVLVLSLPGPWPGKVARQRDDSVELLTGLLPGPGLSYLFTSDDVRVKATPLFGGAPIEGAARVGVGDDPDCCDWWKHSVWSEAKQQPEAGLLRAVSPPNSGWSLLELLRPGSETPAWRLEFRVEPSRIAAAALSPDGGQAILALSDGAGQGRLVAIKGTDGQELWQTPCPGEVHGWRAREGRLWLDDHRGLLLLDGSEGLFFWIFRLEDGKTLARVTLKDFTIPPEPQIGLKEDELWIFQYLEARSTEFTDRAEACVYAVWNLTSGERTRLSDSRWGQMRSEGISHRWQEDFNECRVRYIQSMGSSIGIWTQPAPWSLELYRGPLP